MSDIKKIYLILIGIVSIVAVTLLSTKALFVSVNENDNNVSIESGLSYNFSVNSNEQFILEKGQSVRFDAVVTNDLNDGPIYYELWYKMVSPTSKPNTLKVAEITDGALSTSGNLEVGTENGKVVSILIQNDGESSVTVKVGLSAGYVGNEIIYLENETLITEKVGTSEAPSETWSGVGGTITIDDCEKITTIGTVNGVTQVVDKFTCPTVSGNGADTSGASLPNLYDGMIPIKWNGNTIAKADVINPKDNVWYNYADKQWANAVMVTSNTRDTYMDASVGTTINTSDILGYWVWIPRYSYQLFNATFTSGTSPQ